MIIPITLASSSSSNPRLPSGLAKISHDEVVLVELQGSLEVEGSRPRGRDGKLVGKLTVDEAASRATLLIGHHLLEGKVAALPKPLAVLLRNTSPSKQSPFSQTIQDSLEDEGPEGEEGDPAGSGSDEAMAVDSPGLPPRARASSSSARSGPTKPVQDPESQTDLQLEPSAGWTITAIVKRKIIFSKRPMPVMNKK